jgi:hypothetical protein
VLNLNSFLASIEQVERKARFKSKLSLNQQVPVDFVRKEINCKLGPIEKLEKIEKLEAVLLAVPQPRIRSVVAPDVEEEVSFVGKLVLDLLHNRDRWTCLPVQTSPATALQDRAPRCVFSDPGRSGFA